MDDSPENPTTVAGGMSLLDEDLLQNILEKLPAKSFASAACVNRSWNGTCGRILSHPKLCSAVSLNPSVPVLPLSLFLSLSLSLSLSVCLSNVFVG